uniref:Uncharacterized protein n=1 Tax=Brassica campestris TaxID=3711 RepID=A0A3P5YVX9_BRACM|nr:unnamed protein product [Brassica rapa]
MKITACYLLSSVNMWMRIDHPQKISSIPYILTVYPSRC